MNMEIKSLINPIKYILANYLLRVKVWPEAHRTHIKRRKIPTATPVLDTYHEFTVTVVASGCVKYLFTQC